MDLQCTIYLFSSAYPKPQARRIVTPEHQTPNNSAPPFRGVESGFWRGFSVKITAACQGKASFVRSTWLGISKRARCRGRPSRVFRSTLASTIAPWTVEMREENRGISFLRARNWASRVLQGYLAHKKLQSPRTTIRPCAYAYCRVLGQGVFL